MGTRITSIWRFGTESSTEKNQLFKEGNTDYLCRTLSRVCDIASSVTAGAWKSQDSAHPAQE